MTQSEVISKLSHECCLAMGDFDYFQTVQTYIQMALRVGIEHFTKDMEEIVALYKDGTEAGRFKSVENASRTLGVTYQNISAVLTGRQHTAGGLMFVKTKDYELIPREPLPTPRLF
jgi:hypothetical protein